MDKETRNHINRATQAARTLLEQKYREQLEGTYDVLLDGTIADSPGDHLSDRQTVIRSKLVAAVAHKRSTGIRAKEAVDAYLREAAFTTLNRFVALKMLEARKLVQECVSKGEESNGFKEFTALAPGLATLEDKGYRLYIETLFDEIGQEVKVLFDRRDVFSQLWPDRQTLLELLGILNAPELTSVWAEDETIGWVYQYFNGDEERTKMRAESQAPRNSRELAVRNQFFTPRYVVQFLTDNTLGRTWYEMMQGDTQLAQLDYLVRRPNEVFLTKGESAPESATNDSEFSQEDLLQQTVHVAFRAKKDPRDMRILDPACGSGHFLLYTFDLLIVIYEEAWADAGGAAFTETDNQLREDYESLVSLRRAMPELILRHNLHGVDIDPRAAQIAALALWMRAQRAFNQFEADRAQRPPITKTNIVVAEPMPGDADLVEEFATSLKPAVLGDLFKKMVEETYLAGELGSLLKIEESIARTVDETAESTRQGTLFDGQAENQVFWDTADEKIIEALGRFAESAEGATGVRRQLFAGDATQGVAFIELMRKRFDVVLMNPPFGQVSTSTREYLYAEIPESARDIIAAFQRRMTMIAETAGFVGVISNRLGFSNEFLDDWRGDLFLGRLATLTTAADLGYGVLDAVVETAAIVTTRARLDSAIFVNLLGETNKADALLFEAGKVRRGVSSSNSYIRKMSSFDGLPARRILHSCSPTWVARLSKKSTGHTAFWGRGGICTGDDFRFYRTFWEIPLVADDRSYWRPLAKGGEFSRYRPNTHLVIDWIHKPSLLRTKNRNLYGMRGATYTYRTTSNLSARVLNDGVCFSQGGPALVAKDPRDASFVVMLANSFAATYALEAMVGGGDYSVKGSAARNLEPRYLEFLPDVEITEPDRLFFDSALAELVAILTGTSDDEAHPLFYPPSLRAPSFPDFVEDWEARAFAALSRGYEIVRSSETRIAQLLEMSDADFAESYGDSGWPLPSESPDPVSSELAAAINLLVALPLDASPELLDEGNVNRFEMKLSHYLHAGVEAISHRYEVSPEWVCSTRAQLGVAASDVSERLAKLCFSMGVGLVMGRWRGSTAERASNDLFEAPPLSGAAVQTVRSASEGVGNGDSIWVDDVGHADDLVAELQRRAFDSGSSMVGLEADLPKGDFRSYLKSGYFLDHIRAYSKSRRKAPVYWQLATPSASYSVWCYYHRLTRDTFFRVANDYVTPKIDHEERKLNTLRQKAGPNPSIKRSKEINAQETFVGELLAFLTEVKRVAPLWNPNLNDGVIINFAPLWRLVPQNKAWQKECKKVWDKLVKGDYDWAHLAMHLWPERVTPKCRDDRSLAIAHGLEEEFWYQDEQEKWHKRKLAADRLAELVTERSYPAVKAALEDLLSARNLTGASLRRRKRA